MVKLIILIDCDSCRKPFDDAAVYNTPVKPSACQSRLAELKHSAKQRGWHFSAGRFLCKKCIDDGCKMAASLREIQENL